MHKYVLFKEKMSLFNSIYFQLREVNYCFQARGLRRWCSFIVFTRDKQFLLNMWPFLVDNLKEIIKELQEFAEKKYNAEEAECPQRVVRMATANGGPASQSNSNKQSRGLSEITNEKHVFVR